MKLPFTLREEHRLKMFLNRVLRRIFGPKIEEVARGWRRLHIEELCNFLRFTKCYYGDQIKEDEMGGACSTHGRDEKCV
jgi:hypothetical protein